MPAEGQSNDLHHDGFTKEPSTVSEAPIVTEPSPEFVALVAQRVVEKLSDKVIREIAKDAVPRIAEKLIREALVEDNKA
jgi:hypothetical protein